MGVPNLLLASGAIYPRYAPAAIFCREPRFYIYLVRGGSPTCPSSVASLHMYISFFNDMTFLSLIFTLFLDVRQGFVNDLSTKKGMYPAFSVMQTCLFHHGILFSPR